MEQEIKKKRVRRTPEELLKEESVKIKRLKAKAKANAAANQAKIGKLLYTTIKKELGRELVPEDVERHAAFLKDQDDRGNFFKTAMEREI